MIQIIEQTHEEKVAMYMKLEKEELIAMLIQSNKLLELKQSIVINYPVIYPNQTLPYYDWTLRPNHLPFYDVTCSAQ